MVILVWLFLVLGCDRLGCDRLEWEGLECEGLQYFAGTACLWRLEGVVGLVGVGLLAGVYCRRLLHEFGGERVRHWRVHVCGWWRCGMDLRGR